MKFSIVIPTRNRAGKLRHALRSALHQAFDDYEVLVSNNQSTDDTEQVVEQFADRRLRYVKAPRSMSMVDHWEFALEQARGEWVLFVCDDDALMPGALASLDSAAERHPSIELIQYGILIYVYADGTAIDGNYVDLPAQIRQSCRLHNSQRRLRRSFRRLSGDMPKFLNSAVNARLIDRLRNQYGRVFWDWAPDYSSASLLLANTRTYARTSPLMLWGENMESYGAGSARDPAHMLRFLEQFESFKGELSHSPYPKLLTVQNCVYDTFSRIRKTLGRDFSDLEIDPVRFRRVLIKDCRRYLAGGHSQFAPIARQLNSDLNALYWQRLLDPVWAVQSTMDGAYDFAARLARSIRRRVTGVKRKQRHRFENIADAAEFAGRLACPVQVADSKIHMQPRRAA
jgi:glycosyltransferase involved in cell wall biosynthesis